VPVVPQGTRTGLAGGAAALDGALVLCLERMDAILAIDPVDRVAVVQPGVVTARLAAAVAEHGLFYAPDPASAETSTIGGNIATNAGGMRCVKYGVTRDAVRALELVLADGRVLRTGTVTAKGVAGLDLVGLVVGSEGTLAVVTEATLALLPAPGPTRGVCATFPDVASALATVRDILAGPHTPSTLELLDSVVVGAIAAYDEDAGLPRGAGALVLALTDAATGGEQDVAAYEAAARRHGALAVQVEDDPARVDGLLRARRAYQPAMKALRGDSLNGDIAVPLSRLPELVGRLRALSDEAGLPIGTGGHVGDGNLHPVVAFDPADAGERRRARAAYEAFGRIAIALGGTATGEHGIGLERLDVVATELGADLVGLQRAVKAAFDPAGILNPGKKY
jgi:glycolate oxidase